MKALFLHSPTHRSVQLHHHHQCHSLSIPILPSHPFVPFSSRAIHNKHPMSSFVSVVFSINASHSTFIPSSPTLLSVHRNKHKMTPVQPIHHNNALVKCQHTAQVKRCEPCAAYQKCCNRLDTLPSNSIACAQSITALFVTSKHSICMLCCGVFVPLR